MDRLRVPKFENEADEADWFYEHREELATEFMNQHRRDGARRGARLEAVLRDALQTRELLVTPEELEGRDLVSVLRERLAQN
jgi:hypothetical protein